MAKAQKLNDIDGYMAQFPADVQAILEKVRETIRHAAPDATEVISYQMPAFKQHGILVYFAAWKKHIGLYPPISGDKTLEKGCNRPPAKSKTLKNTGFTSFFDFRECMIRSKGNLQFSLDEPIPYDLIERIVKLRVKQDTEKAAARRKQSQTARKERESK